MRVGLLYYPYDIQYGLHRFAYNLAVAFVMGEIDSLYVKGNMKTKHFNRVYIINNNSKLLAREDKF